MSGIQTSGFKKMVRLAILHDLSANIWMQYLQTHVLVERDFLNGYSVLHAYFLWTTSTKCHYTNNPSVTFFLLFICAPKSKLQLFTWQSYYFLVNQEQRVTFRSFQSFKKSASCLSLFLTGYGNSSSWYGVSDQLK